MNRVEHLVDIAGEEGAEVAVRASKVNRFSMGEIQAGQEFTNAQRMVREFWDLQEAMLMLYTETGAAGGPFFELSHELLAHEHRAAKRAKVEHMLLVSREQGALHD